VPQPWFDGHLDLAYLAETGRDMLRRAEEVSTPDAPNAVTLPSLHEGNVRAALGTIFVQRRVTGKGPHEDVDGTWCFSSPDEAHIASIRQLSVYLGWHQDGLIDMFGAKPRVQRKDFTLPPASRGLYDGPAPLRLLLLLEGAAGLRSVSDLDTFHASGVRVIALTWVDGTKWAGGDQSGGGLTADGKALVARIDTLNMVHDTSHLSEQAFWELFDCASRPKIASHSNCRALLPGKKHPERHLSDQQIRAIAGAGGIIGINLFCKFLVTTGRATIADAVRHIQHMTQLVGRADFVGLGSDMDGGFNANELPEGLDHPRHLPRLADALAAANFSDADIKGFAYDNWSGFLKRHLGF
jgi:membrane dipeptidase